MSEINGLQPTTTSNTDYTGYRLEDMPSDVRQVVEKFRFDTDGDGAIDGQDDVMGALMRAQQDRSITPQERQLLEFVGPRIAVVKTDPSQVTLRSPQAERSIQAALQSGDQATQIMGLGEEVLKGVTIAERLDMVEALMVHNESPSYQHEQKVLDILELTPEHQQAELVSRLFREGRVQTILDRAPTNEGHELLQQYMHRHMWNLDTVGDISVAMDELGVMQMRDGQQVTDFSGLMYLLSTLRANRDEEFTNMVVADLQARGVFAQIMPYAFDPMYAGERFHVTGLGAVDAQSYREHLQDLLEVLPEGPTKSQLMHSALQRFGVYAPADIRVETRTVYLNTMYDAIYLYPRGYHRRHMWRYTPVGAYYFEPHLYFHHDYLDMPFWNYYSFHRPWGYWYGSHSIHIFHDHIHRHRYNWRSVRHHYHHDWDRNRRPGSSWHSVRSRHAWGQNGHINYTTRERYNGGYRNVVNRRPGSARSHSDIQNHRSRLNDRRTQHGSRLGNQRPGAGRNAGPISSYPSSNSRPGSSRPGSSHTSGHTNFPGGGRRPGSGAGQLPPGRTPRDRGTYTPGASQRPGSGAGGTYHGGRQTTPNYGGGRRPGSSGTNNRGRQTVPNYGGDRRPGSSTGPAYPRNNNTYQRRDPYPRYDRGGSSGSRRPGGTIFSPTTPSYPRSTPSYPRSTPSYPRHTPSFPRSGGNSRPGGGYRPSGGGYRPSGGGYRPSGGGSRSGGGNRRPGS